MPLSFFFSFFFLFSFLKKVTAAEAAVKEEVELRDKVRFFYFVIGQQQRKILKKSFENKK